MRFLLQIVTLLLVALVSACGGGGGSPGLSSGSKPTFAVVAPATVVIQSGGLQRYAITGGIKPYSTYSTDQAVAIGWISGDDYIYVGASATGKATVTVADAAGSKYDISVTSGSSTPFYTTAPAAITLSPGSSGAQSYALGGGTGPYTAVSGDTSVLSAVVNGNTLTLTGLRVSANAVTVTLRDLAGVTLTTSVIVQTVPLTINPSSVTTFIGDTVFARISGGSPPYKVDVSVKDIVTTSIANTTELTITSIAGVNNLEVSVIDSANQIAKLTLSAGLGDKQFRVSPSALTVAAGEAQPVTLTMYGKSSTGTTKVYSSHPDVLGASVSGNVVTLVRTVACVKANTDVTITVVDGQGSIGIAKVTVLNNATDTTACAAAPVPVAFYVTTPSAVTIPVGGGGTSFAIGGGTAPYTATSSNANVVSAVVSGGNVTLTGLQAGTASVEFRDAAGTTVKSSVTVASSAGAFFTTTPASVTLVAGSSGTTYALGGGTGPYTATSSNTSVLTASVSGANVTLTGLLPGTSTVSFRDSAGATAQATVTVVSSTGAFFTTAPGSVTLISGTAGTIYVLGGGTAPYSATSSNASVVSAVVSGAGVTLTGLQPGSSTVVFRDSAGATTQVSVTVASATGAFYSTAPGSVTLIAGSGGTSYTMGGGTAPYSATSSNTSVLSAVVSGQNVTLTGLQVGSASVVFRDSAGATVLVNVTVAANSTLAFYTTAPTTVTIPVNSTGVTYTLGGGTPPYTATSSNASVIGAAVSGTGVTLTGLQAGSATVVFRDAAGAIVQSAVTAAAASSATLAAYPSSVTAFINDSVNFRITGGAAPYKVDAGVTDALTVTGPDSSGLFTVKILRAMSGYTLTILDSNSQSTSVSLNSGAGTNQFRLSPATFTMPETKGASATVTAYGMSGASSAVKLFTSDASLLTVSSGLDAASQATVTRTNNCIAGTGNISVTITAIDANGAIGTSTVTVQKANTAGGC